MVLSLEITSKLNVYADNTVTYITDIEQSAIKLYDILENDGPISGSKVNLGRNLRLLELT